METAQISIYKEMVKYIMFELCNRIIYSPSKGWDSFIITDPERLTWYIKCKKAAKCRLVNVMSYSFCLKEKRTYTCMFVRLWVLKFFSALNFLLLVYNRLKHQSKMLLKMHLWMRRMGVFFHKSGHEFMDDCYSC